MPSEVLQFVFLAEFVFVEVFLFSLPSVSVAQGFCVALKLPKLSLFAVAPCFPVFCFEVLLDITVLLQVSCFQPFLCSRVCFSFTTSHFCVAEVLIALVNAHMCS